MPTLGELEKGEPPMPTARCSFRFILLVLCTLSLGVAQAIAQSAFTIPLTGQESYGNRKTTIEFGLHPDATICEDRSLGEYALPPPPPGFYVYFTKPSLIACYPSTGMLKDLRSSTEPIPVDTFSVSFQYNDISLPDTMTFSWPDLRFYYAGDVTLSYQKDRGDCTTDEVRVDMKSTNSIAFRHLPADCSTPSRIRIFAERSTATGVEPSGDAIPTSFSLSQNYPNPFNPSTKIGFALPVNADVTLSIFNVLGMEVATLVSQHLPAGNYTVRMDAANLSSGLYFYTLRAGGFAATKKLVLAK